MANLWVGVVAPLLQQQQQQQQKKKVGCRHEYSFDKAITALSAKLVT
jgi:hypothetical protein